MGIESMFYRWMAILGVFLASCGQMPEGDMGMGPIGDRDTLVPSDSTSLGDVSGPLKVTIASPVSDLVIKLGDSVTFTGGVEAAAGAQSDLEMLWVSDHAGVLWEGQPDADGEVAFTWEDPPAGQHGVTLQAITSKAQVATETVTFFVNQPPVAP